MTWWVENAVVALAFFASLVAVTMLLVVALDLLYVMRDAGTLWVVGAVGLVLCVGTLRWMNEKGY